MDVYFEFVYSLIAFLVSKYEDDESLNGKLLETFVGFSTSLRSLSITRSALMLGDLVTLSPSLQLALWIYCVHL